MANAANSPFVKHPALLALFAPRPPPPFKAPMPSKPMGKLTGIAQFTAEFGKVSNHASPKKYETPTQRKIRVIAEKKERHLQILTEREKQWDPHNNPNATKDPYKTLFVARLSYDLTEDDLRREFERYGRIHCVKLITDKNTQKSRGYAFIEFERSNDLKEAFQHADGHKLKGRRILVDVERGRTVKTWKPRKLGGGLGKTRAGPNTNEKHKLGVMHHGNGRHSSRGNNKGSSRDMRRNDRSGKKSDKYSNRRDKYRDRDYRDRDRRTRGDRDRKEQVRTSRNERDRDNRRKKSRSRSRDKKDRSKRIKKENKERERSRIDENKYDKDTSRHNGRKDRDRERERDNNNNKDRDRSRRRRSRSKEKTRERRR